MKVSRNKKQFQISFDSNNQANNIFDREEQNDIINKFIQPCPYFKFDNVTTQEIQKFKKKVIGSANQYGIKNQKTTSIFLSLLEVTRQIATNQLRKKQYGTACKFYAMCLGFIDPDDELFLEKFIITKIDIINKLMFCLFQLKQLKQQEHQRQQQQERQKERQKQRQTININISNSLLLLENFLQRAKKYAFQSNLLKSDVCMIELNYFYLGKVYVFKNKLPNAIQALKRAQQIISLKQRANVYEKNPSLDAFSKNLQIKIFYKISKCYRDEQKKEQLLIYEGKALQQAQKYNAALYQYISKQIRMYKSSKQFNEVLANLEGKKKIEEYVLKLIEQTNQKEIKSLYNVYSDRPHSNSSCDIMFKEHQNGLSA